MPGSSTASQCRIHDGHGHVSTLRAITWSIPSGDLEIPTRTIADLIPITEIMSRDVVCARPDLPIESLVQLLVRNYLGCVPVVDERGRPTGMVTKRDLVEQIDTLFAVASAADDPTARSLLPGATRDLMMPLAITVDEHATVAHVAAIMTLERVHHIVVVSEAGVVIGIASALDIVGWLSRNDGYVTRQSLEDAKEH